MNMRKAFKHTVALAVDNQMPRLSGTSFGLDHIIDMESRITPEFSEAKLGRWLGWAQCAVVMSGAATLDDMKRINMAMAHDET